MYLNILKKDLKRKKTMNIILLLFIALAAMYVSSSVNNIIAVTGGLDYYFGKAGITDYFTATMSKSLTEDIKTTLDNSDNVESYGIEPVIYLSSGNVFYNGKKTDKINNTSFIMPCDKMQITYFDADNNPIRSVEKGKILVSGSFIKNTGMSIGDKIEIKIGSTKKSFEIAGNFKDAALGSKMMNMIRFMINPEDYEFFSADSDAGLYEGSLCYIKSNDVTALDKELSSIDSGIAFMCTKATLKFTYVMNMIVACILLVVSVCLILISFAALSFTITFTLNEEFREIGVMKAIGINNTKIRGLYIVKYIALSVIGSVIGFFAGIPFGNMLLKSVSEKMVIGSERELCVKDYKCVKR